MTLVGPRLVPKLHQRKDRYHRIHLDDYPSNCQTGYTLDNCLRRTMSKKGADIDSALCHGCSKVPSRDHVFKCPSCKHNFCNDCTLTCDTEWMCYAKLCPNCNNKECPQCCRRYCGSCDYDMSWKTCWQCKEEACQHCTEHNGVTFWDHLCINSIFVCYDCMSSE